jgi:23S rRNA U2552 (ribose-2'-O)-methylase RlmE/FtsJ
MSSEKTYKQAFHSKRKYPSLKFENYFEIFDLLAGHLYDSKITYLELGVADGGSLEIARKLFGEKSTIIGVDLYEDKSFLKNDGTANHIIFGNQTSDETKNKLISITANSGIDIIVDDGSHISEDMILSFIKLFPLLNENGIYIIEDLNVINSSKHYKSFYGITIFDYMKGLSENLNNPFRDFSRAKDRYKEPRETRKPFSIKNKGGLLINDDIVKQIFSIQWFENMVAITKKTKPEPLSLWI